MTITTGNRRRPVLHYKPTWSADWITAPRGSYQLDQVEVGASNSLGSCQIDVLRAATVNREQGAPAEPALGVDVFVRVGAEDPELTTDDRLRWLWYGVQTSLGYTDHGTETTGTETSQIVILHHRCEGLGSLLRRATYQRTLITSHTGATASLPRPLPFNPRGIGNRSLTAEADGTYAFRLDADPATCARWTARQALQRILTDHFNATQFPTLPAFALAGQVTALDYYDTWEHLAGMTIDQIITTLAGGRRGMTWSVEPDHVDGGQVLPIRITSSLPVAVAITGAGDIPTITIPATDRVAANPVTTDSHWRVQSDIQPRPRRYTLAGTNYTTLSLTWRPGGPTSYDGLVRGWSAADDNQAGSPDPKYADVFRRWYLDPAWSGQVSSGQGLASTLQRTGGAYDGVRIADGSAIPILLSRLDHDLVYADRGVAADGVTPVGLATWATDATALMPANLPRDQVRVFIDTGTVVSDVSQDFHVHVVNDPRPAIMIGTRPQDAGRIKALLGNAASRRLIVTLTIHEPLPVLISREPANATADQRIETGAELHQVLPGTWVGFSAGGALTATSAVKTIRDDRPILSSILAALGPYLDRAGSATIHHGLELLPADTYAPGSYVASYNNGPSTITLAAIVARKVYQFGLRDYGTTLHLDPVSVDLRAFL